MLFVVVNGIPSVGVQVMVGSGQIGTQPTAAVAALPGGARAVNPLHAAQWGPPEWANSAVLLALGAVRVALLARVGVREVSLKE